ncbi:MAG: hypothetical protein FJX72_08275 [Armatimonadetes bacterium]|nr:hypothetical protein [Armatimonadota bacterium]
MPVPTGPTSTTLPACGGKPAKDPEDKEIPWTYGPTQGGASRTHALGTGVDGNRPVAVGWQCRLVDKKRLTIRPFSLASSHPLFGKAVLHVGLFDRGGTQLATERSGTISAQNASFAFDLADDMAQRLCDVVLWFAEP